MGTNPNFYAASYLVLRDKDKVLLQKRSKNVWGGGYFGLPAGQH